MSEIVSRLEQTQYRISAALEGSNDGWWQWNLEDKTAFLSPKLQELLGISDRNPEQNEGWWEEFVVPKFTERFATLLRDSASDDSGLMMRSSDSAFEFLRGSEIEVVHFHVRVLPIEFDPSGRPRLIAIALRDVSLEIKQKNSIERLAFYDHLTGLANRRLLEVNIEHFVRGLPRLEYKLAIYLLDLDKFKLLNDSKGHAAGDELLIEVASRLRHVTRSTDCVARLGGDEFVVLAKLPAASRSEVDDIAFQLAEKIRESLARSYLIGGTSYQTTSSIGICTDFDSALGSLTPLDKADLALYEAKSQGRNACYLYSESLGLRHVSVISLAERLDQSIAAGQCHVAFQPIVRLDDRQRGERVISSYEALFRPHGFVETVDRIISVAEDRGKVSGITDFVLARVSRFLASHGESASSSSRVSINISPLQFLERDFCESFLGKLECLGVDPSAIAIELTEAVLLRDIAKAGQYMQDLRSQGIRFYLDDFGTGFSSIGYLKDLPFDVVKIDKSYTRDIVLSQKALVIVKAIADLVDGLGAKLIVEGVESEEQLELLHGMGCRFMQGFLFPFVDG